jgi:hypothetical protein
MEESRPLHAEPDLPASPVTSGAAGTLGSVEAGRMVARLPYGLCSLELDGRVSFAHAAAVLLLRARAVG